MPCAGCGNRTPTAGITSRRANHCTTMAGFVSFYVITNKSCWNYFLRLKSLTSHTTVYCQVLIYTGERTGASWRERKYTSLKKCCNRIRSRTPSIPTFYRWTTGRNLPGSIMCVYEEWCELNLYLHPTTAARKGEHKTRKKCRDWPQLWWIDNNMFQ